ncbi:hypothetical protein ABI59_22765 [Acidobacteria bacterium Mor1]|nr:hypothetical protein ABI59_22765 [Acidobacteria bacterium Mor1]
MLFVPLLLLMFLLVAGALCLQRAREVRWDGFPERAREIAGHGRRILLFTASVFVCAAIVGIAGWGREGLIAVSWFGWLGLAFCVVLLGLAGAMTLLRAARFEAESDREMARRLSYQGGMWLAAATLPWGFSLGIAAAVEKAWLAASITAAALLICGWAALLAALTRKPLSMGRWAARLYFVALVIVVLLNTTMRFSPARLLNDPGLAQPGLQGEPGAPDTNGDHLLD